MIKSLVERYEEIKSNKKSGFTLMELVVVIGVMAILALVMVPNLTAYIQKADNAKNQANMKSVHIAAELAVQSNPNIYVKDIATGTNAQLLKKEIANYANMAEGEISVVGAVAAASKRNIFYIYPDSTKTKLEVKFNTDRASYVFNGKAFEEVGAGVTTP